MTIESLFELTAPTLEDIEILARDVYDRLPDEFRERCGDIIFRVEDFPDGDVVEEMELETPETALNKVSPAIRLLPTL